jgi:hypothetical protein
MASSALQAIKHAAAQGKCDWAWQRRLARVEPCQLFSHARRERMRKVFSVSNFCVTIQSAVWRHHRIRNQTCYTAGNRFNFVGWG